MSWSMVAKGTAEACKRVLSGQKVHSPAEGEQEVFDMVRANLFAFLDRGGYEVQNPGAKCIFDLTASGHGKLVSAASFKCEIVWME